MSIRPSFCSSCPAGIAALGGDGVDHRRAVAGIPSVHDDISAVPGQLLGGGPADARG
jgi:hypothetical protein